MSSRVFIGMLRRPRKQDARSGPFLEFGSFHRTGCHAKNLLHPRNCKNRGGDRLAFVQGRHLGSRWLLLTPPLAGMDHPGDGSLGRIELRWNPKVRPFRYDRAPTWFESPGPGRPGPVPCLAKSVARVRAKVSRRNPIDTGMTLTPITPPAPLNAEPAARRCQGITGQTVWPRGSRPGAACCCQPGRNVPRFACMSRDSAESTQPDATRQASPPGPISPLFPYLLGGLLHDVNNTLTVLLLSSEASRLLPDHEDGPILGSSQQEAHLRHVANVVRLMQELARYYYLPRSGSVGGVADRLGAFVSGVRETGTAATVDCTCDPAVETCELPGALIPFVSGELVRNSLRACGAVENPRVSLTVTARADDDVVAISCRDNGPGFSSAQLDDIREGKLRPPSAGLKGGCGLYFVSEIASRLQGRVLVSNLETGGARVEVLLPFHATARA